MAKGLPSDPAVFTLGHELKHHLCDRETAGFQCSFSYGTKDPIEIGAEIFAAELIFPEAEFLKWFAGQTLVHGKCLAEHIVHLKRQTRTTLSYQAIVKRVEFNELAVPGAFAKVKFTKLEEQLYGKPFRRPSKASAPKRRYVRRPFGS